MSGSRRRSCRGLRRQPARAGTPIEHDVQGETDLVGKQHGEHLKGMEAATRRERVSSCKCRASPSRRLAGAAIAAV